jgi:quercetin dioxygenase-like cupin family protein
MSDDDLDPGLLAHSSLHFRRRVVELAPGDVVPIDPDTWEGAIVFLTAGEVELECVQGEHRRFSTGATLCLTPALRAIRNSGRERAQLVAVSRRTRRTG